MHLETQRQVVRSFSMRDHCLLSHKSGINTRGLRRELHGHAVFDAVDGRVWLNVKQPHRPLAQDLTPVWAPAGRRLGPQRRVPPSACPG
jgi:hypothetical protein